MVQAPAGQGAAGQAAEDPRDHVVHFYALDDELAERVASYLADAIQAGGVAIGVATAHHRAAFEARLSSVGVDVTAARARGTLILLDARETMTGFLVDGRPDPVRFHSVIGDLIRGATETGRPVHAYGEMVSLLWDSGQVNAAVELERLWNELGRQLAFSLFCAYRFESVSTDDRVDALRDVCRLHSAVVGGSSAIPAGEGSPASASASRSFSAGVDGPGASRRFVADTIATWGDKRLAEDAALVVTELVTNAVVHARSDFTVTLSSSPLAFRISVRDFSPAHPAPGEAPFAATSGRGLGLISAVSTCWDVEPTGDGKVVWAELPR
jgi:hypothetical protein